MHHTVKVHALNTAHARQLALDIEPGTITACVEHPQTTTFTGGRLHFLYVVTVYVIEA
jgi:hypothetical protein